MQRRHCRGPDRASLGPQGATVSNGCGTLQDAPERHRRARRHRLQKPLRGAFSPSGKTERHLSSSLLSTAIRFPFGFLLVVCCRLPGGGPPRPQEGRRAVPAYQVVQKRQPGSVEKSPPKRAFLRQNTHPVPPLYAAPDGCFKASFRPCKGPKCPEKGVRTLKKEEKTVFSRRTRIIRHLQTPPAVGNQDGTQTNGMNFARACCSRTPHRSSSCAFQSEAFLLKKGASKGLSPPGRKEA